MCNVTCQRTWGPSHMGQVCFRYVPLRHRCRHRAVEAAASQQSTGGFGEGLKRFAKQVQAQLPLVGLLTRLAAPTGGVGNDELSYPEFCRALWDAAPMEFNFATAEWEKLHGKEGQRRYVLLCLWMARQGAGVVPSKQIAAAARRVRVTQDIEIEMDRFEASRDAVFKQYSYAERPTGKLQDQIDLAVDSICRVTLGLNDGVEVSPRDAEILTEMVAAAFADQEGAQALVQRSVRSRKDRANAYL
ncbi:hypothetical protein WJX72_004064 [[Myrmecia] bisecta]|uniref:Uncharacterized protein n=1 Tax=[Myrmecia] bisecta TaxID=41462 RepID=A0AAW1QQ64_9CHLO